MTRTSPIKEMLSAISQWKISNWEIIYHKDYDSLENYWEIKEQLFAEYMGWTK